jgi:hypothetical protein
MTASKPKPSEVVKTSEGRQYHTDLAPGDLAPPLAHLWSIIRFYPTFNFQVEESYSLVPMRLSASTLRGKPLLCPWRRTVPAWFPIFSSSCNAIRIPRIEQVLNFGYAECVDKGVRRENSPSFIALSGIKKGNQKANLSPVRHILRECQDIGLIIHTWGSRFKKITELGGPVVYCL